MSLTERRKKAKREVIKAAVELARFRQQSKFFKPKKQIKR